MCKEVIAMKLNLGCGDKILDGWINIDKFDTFKVDIVHDLERIPYPFEDDSVDEILLSHVLEHLGQNPDTFNNIIMELYRICKNNCVINIVVPHPRHDDFINDPTHVRPITAELLSLYNKKHNEHFRSVRAANTPFATILNVDFRLEKVIYILSDEILEKMDQGKIDKEQLEYYRKHYNNVVKSIELKWRVVK